MTPTASLTQLLEPRGYTTVTLTRTAVGHLRVEAVVNREPASFIVDTGASATVIDRQSADRWNLMVEGASESAVGCNLSASATPVTLDELRCGSVRLTNVVVYAVDLSQINVELEKKDGSRVDGIIGADLLTELQAVIEYAGRHLHLKPIAP